MNMNNLYIETATELVSVFTLLNDAVAKGGTETCSRGGTEQNPVGFERPARGIQPETASALFEPALLYPERRVEQHNGGYDRPQQRRGGPSGHVPLAQGGSHRPLKKDNKNEER